MNKHYLLRNVTPTCQYTKNYVSITTIDMSHNVEHTDTKITKKKIP